MTFSQLIDYYAQRLNMLDVLPNELILQILASMPDLGTLQAFLRAYPATQDLFFAFSEDVILSTISQNTPLQIQNLICTDLYIRQDPFIINLEYLGLVEYLDLHLEDDKAPPLLESLSDPIVALKRCVTVIRDIKCHVQAFVSSRMRKPGVAKHLMPTQDPASRTELLRIRRGFWRLHLLCELLVIQQLIYGKVTRDDVMDAFMDRLTPWEVEEMECVYYFLREQYQKVKTPEGDPKLPNPVCEQSPRVQRMLRSFGYYLDDRRPPCLNLASNGSAGNGSEDRNFMEEGFRWARDQPEVPEVSTFRSDDVASSGPSAGWLYFAKYSSRYVDGCAGYGDTARGPVLCFLNWGYCMWCKERLDSWGVLGEDSFLEIWEDGYSGRGLCAHCC